MSDLQSLLESADRARLDDRPDEARALLLDAVDASRASSDRQMLGRALAKLGQIERDSGRVEAALELYREAAGIAREEGEQLVVAHRLRHIADIRLDRNQIDLAEPLYDEALALYRSRGDTPPLDLANALRPMAIMREKQGRAAEAALLFAEARDLYAKTGVEAGAAECERRIGRLSRG